MATIKIKGMSCQHCVTTVTKALTAVEGLSNVTVNLADNSATYTDTGTKPVDSNIIKKAIARIGFEMISG